MLNLSEQDGFGRALGRKALLGFLVSGVLLSFTGAMLPAWGFNFRSEYSIAGNYFLCVNLGLLVSLALAGRLLQRKGISAALTVGCIAAFASLTALGFSASGVSHWIRYIAFTGIGLSAGVINTSLFRAISPLYRRAPAATVNLAGIFFCLGCLIVSVLVASTFHTYTVPSILFLIALIPAFLAIAFARTEFSREPYPVRAHRAVSGEFRGPVAALFSLLLFLQFGNEFAIAGWLPLFLVQRLGMSPARALTMLAIYWFTLLIGRIVAQAMIPRVSHPGMLIFSAMAAMFGCLVLSLTNNLLGVTLGTLFVAFGFAAVYPLVVEKIGVRFPGFHPGLHHGVFSLALTGGLLTPALLGYLADYAGIRVVMLVPALGTSLVFLLVAAIMIEARFSGQPLS